ncbi:hypothetical protein, partial [Intestinimonas butyriciproducens]|uniref:hypothetical protein n=1 Tax=Intestinimonas butyriciproducens TaxID=1297617 RepID=UPI003AF1BC96
YWKTFALSTGLSAWRPCRRAGTSAYFFLCRRAFFSRSTWRSMEAYTKARSRGGSAMRAPGSRWNRWRA